MARPVIDWTLGEVFTAEFIESCCRLFNRCGVYSFWHSASECVYIGMSQDLGSRMQSSFKERVLHHPGEAMFSVIEAGSRTEAEMIESALIKKTRPTLNRDYRKAGRSEFDASGIEWGSLATCKEAGVLAFRHGAYVIYPHNSIHAAEEMRLRSVKENRRRRYEEMLMGSFAGDCN